MLFIRHVRVSAQPACLGEKGYAIASQRVLPKVSPTYWLMYTQS